MDCRHKEALSADKQAETDARIAGASWSAAGKRFYHTPYHWNTKRPAHLPIQAKKASRTVQARGSRVRQL